MNLCHPVWLFPCTSIKPVCNPNSRNIYTNTFSWGWVLMRDSAQGTAHDMQGAICQERTSVRERTLTHISHERTLTHVSVCLPRHVSVVKTPPEPARTKTDSRILARQHSATHYNTVQHSATHCNTVQYSATQCNTISRILARQHSATQCNTVQHSVTQCNTVQHSATQCNTVQHNFANSRTTGATGRQKGCTRAWLGRVVWQGVLRW